MNEDQIRYRAAHPVDNSGAQAQLSTLLLVLDELRAIRKLLEPEQRVGVAAPEPEPPAHPLRAEWDSMLPHQRAHFGSFESYCALQVQLDIPDDEPVQIKWVAAEHLTRHQIRNAMGHHEGKYAVQVGELTAEQRALP